ncbi:putative GH16 domain-containing protein [Seiridium unicorne]|uniref:GH16 domain-containing protein n=1 Tax=Seiridium unicorne TaxID=138068 RepID=A0ABR2V4J5_9PEZI
MASSLIKTVGLVATLYAASTSTTSTKSYTVTDVYNSTNFLDRFDFFMSDLSKGGDAIDPTGGYVQYQDRGNAEKLGLVSVDDDEVYIGPDTALSYDQYGYGRKSVRLEGLTTYSQGLFITDFSHLPKPTCGAWPSFWMYGDPWPTKGEVDIVENWNDLEFNRNTAHVNDPAIIGNCTIQKSDMTASLIESANCWDGTPDQYANQGCSADAYGLPFGSSDGGVYALEITSDHLKIWSWTKALAPLDITLGKPQPLTWGLPSFTIQDCNIEKAFFDLKFVWNIDFCGVARLDGIWDSCKAKTGYSSCMQYVAENPEDFKSSYFKIADIKVYELTDNANTTSSTSGYVTSTTSSTTSSTASSTITNSPSSSSSSASSTTNSVSSTVSSTSTSETTSSTTSTPSSSTAYETSTSSLSSSAFSSSSASKTTSSFTSDLSSTSTYLAPESVTSATSSSATDAVSSSSSSSISDTSSSSSGSISETTGFSYSTTGVESSTVSSSSYSHTSSATDSASVSSSTRVSSSSTIVSASYSVTESFSSAITSASSSATISSTASSYSSTSSLASSTCIATVTTESSSSTLASYSTSGTGPSSTYSSTTSITESTSFFSYSVSEISSSSAGPETGTSSSPTYIASAATSLSVPTGSASSTIVTESRASVTTSTDIPEYTTSTVYTTRVQTVTSCAPTVTSCMVGGEVVVAETVPLYTTVCPIMATEISSLPTTTPGVPESYSTSTLKAETSPATYPGDSITHPEATSTGVGSIGVSNTGASSTEHETATIEGSTTTILTLRLPTTVYVKPSYSSSASSPIEVPSSSEEFIYVTATAIILPVTTTGSGYNATVSTSYTAPKGTTTGALGHGGGSGGSVPTSAGTRMGATGLALLGVFGVFFFAL